MFFLRSAFWLVVGFLLVAPHGTDFGAAATTLKDQAVEAGIKAGEEIVVSQLTATHSLPVLLVSVAKTPLNTASLDTAFLAPAIAPVLPRSRPAALS